MATLKNHPSYWLRDDAAAAFDKYEDDHGVISVNSAGRSKAEQQALLNRWAAGGKYNRPPYLYKPDPVNVSRHVINGGVAVDTSHWRKFAEKCRQYGFTHPYPSGDPVHFEYVGGESVVTTNDTTASRQRYLKHDMGEGDLVADGIEGPRTKAAYKRYQTTLKKAGLYAGAIDGIWGAGTEAAHKKYKAQKESQSSSSGTGAYVDTKGSSNPSSPFGIGRISGLQKIARLYTYTGPIDNIWGVGSAKGFAEFLKRNWGYSGNHAFGPVMAASIARWLRAKWGYVGNDVYGPVMAKALKRAEEANYREL